MRFFKSHSYYCNFSISDFNSSERMNLEFIRKIAFSQKYIYSQHLQHILDLIRNAIASVKNSLNNDITKSKSSMIDVLSIDLDNAMTFAVSPH